MREIASYNGSADIGLTAGELADFARTWPCFGDQTNPADYRGCVLWMTFDPRGDLVDIGGDEGLDPAGVAALVEDARAHLKTLGHEYA